MADARQSATTISKFGVPDGTGGGRGGIIAVKLKYRFRVTFYGFGPNTSAWELSRQVESVGRPSITYEKGTLHAYNSITYFAGKHRWNPISLTVKDDITNDSVKRVGYQLQKQLNHLTQTALKAGSNYKFNMAIETLDGGDTEVVDRWDLEGCWLEDVKYGEFNYTAMAEFNTIEMSIAYDNAMNSQPNEAFPQSPQPSGTGNIA